MQDAAENFEFEKAIELREEWFELEKASYKSKGNRSRLPLL